jgi:hypothetical protein
MIAMERINGILTGVIVATFLAMTIPVTAVALTTEERDAAKVERDRDKETATAERDARNNHKNRNNPPTISGDPPRSVDLGNAYAFMPNAKDPDGDFLTFFISGQPSWAYFDPATGELFGNPTDSADVGTTAEITISVSDGQKLASLAPFTVTVVKPAGVPPPDTNVPPDSNTAPTISGTPAASVVEGASYYFAPSATDSDGDLLTLIIENKPAWANFNSSTGELSGTPGAGDVGIEHGIVIDVSDGTTSVSLPTFDIEVKAIAPTGSVTLTWNIPTTNEDGSPLTDLAGFRVYYGRTPDQWHTPITLGNPGLTAHFLEGLDAGSWYGTVTAFDHAGNESREAKTVGWVIQ